MKIYSHFKIFLTASVLMLLQGAATLNGQTIIDAAKTYGIRPGAKNVTARFNRAVADIRSRYNGRAVRLVLRKGTYDFYPDDSGRRTYFISNHDQSNPKYVGIAIERVDSLIIEGNDSEFLFHGRMLPISIIGARGCAVRNVSVDFPQPQITQVEIIESDSVSGTLFRVADYVKARINSAGSFEAYGQNWIAQLWGGIAFEPDTRRVVYRSSDRGANLMEVKEVAKGVYSAPRWFDPVLKKGTVMALRNGDRPAPGFFLSESVNPMLENVTVHYAEGMGVLAQLCDSVTLKNFSVKLRGKNDPRYFTTQADATHFSGCKGLISSTDGFYEGMMDDAINVHGTYLKVVGREDSSTLLCRYMHNQSYGFAWGHPGDSVQFVKSRTMDLLAGQNAIETIEPLDADGENNQGVRTFRIRFKYSVPAEVCDTAGYGVENLAWTPEVYFARNTIRNNRARGSLFSTPRATIVEDNIFDHTSGTAILLCGDCNGWYETGACRDVTIRRNKFINALTSLFQFTEAVISIYPEIPDIAGQSTYFHGGNGFPGVRIYDNQFDTFDAPLLYAKSISGLVFSNNTIRHNQEYPAYHHNTYNIKLRRAVNVVIKDNSEPLSVIVE